MLFTLTVNGTAAEITALLAPLANNAEAVTNLPVSEGKFEPSETSAYIPEPPAPTNGKAKATPAPAPAKPAAQKPKITELPAAKPKPEPVAAVIPADDAFADDLPTEAVTLDMIRLASKAKLSKQPQIIAILGEYGAANMSALDPDHYEAVYKAIADL